MYFCSCWVESGKGALAAFILPIVIVIVVRVLYRNEAILTRYFLLQITCAFLMISIRILYANQRKSVSENKSTRSAVKCVILKITVASLVASIYECLQYLCV